MISVGWAFLGSAALNEQSSSRPSGARRLGGALVLAGLVSALAGLWVFAVWSAGSPHSLVPVAAVLAVVVGGGMGAAAVGVVLALTPGPAEPPRAAGRSPRAAARVGPVGSRT